MAAGLHGSARTTPRVRAGLRASQGATRVLAARYGLNPRTVARWRGRATAADQPMGPSRPRGTVLSDAEEAIVVEFRRRALPPLDAVLGCLRESIPKLTRGALHRCLARPGLSRLPKDDENASRRGSFAATRIGSVRIEHCGPRLTGGKLHMFLAIDRVSEFAHVAVLDAATKMNGAAFPREVIAAFRHAISHRADRQRHGLRRPAPEQDRADPSLAGRPIFDRVRQENGIEHRPTKPCHPWSLEDRQTGRPSA
jgi:hypothetical protein